MEQKKNAECWNLYAYCANNPINYVDPSGHTASLIQSGQYLPAEAWESIKKIEKDSNSNNKNNKKKNKLTNCRRGNRRRQKIMEGYSSYYYE